MSGSTFITAAAWSYGVAALGFVAFVARVLIGWRPNVRSSLLLAASAATALWALASLWSAVAPSSAALASFTVTDVLRYALWFAFMLRLLAPTGTALTAAPLPGWVKGLGAALLLASLLPLVPGDWALGAMGDARIAFGVRVGLAVIGLVGSEQLLRRSHPSIRWGIQPLVIALAATFGFDLFFFADGLLFGRLDGDIFLARGLANAVVLPLIAISTARNTGWSVEMHVSRTAVFHSTALLLSGTFLLFAAGAGYIVRYFGGDLGRALQIELLFAAVVLFVMIGSSGRFRSRLRVFVSKHFFSYRYDYREEWLRFTRTLADDAAAPRIEERAIMALANLVESPSGLLWRRAESGTFTPAAQWNVASASERESTGGSLVSFLQHTGWIVSVPEYRDSPENYEDLLLPSWLLERNDAWLVVPLISGTELQGFVVLTTPRAPIEMDWEVRDLLKTASRQAASFLGHVHATEALLEARKFDAFNRMSAFVVHDLKNLIAQLSLMLRNAERHRDNPEFQRDMIETVDHVVARMNALMTQLRAGTTPVEKPRGVDLGRVVMRVCAQKSREIGQDLAPGVMGLGHEDRLEHVLSHLVQNAIDATAAGGRVNVRVGREGGFAVVEIVDTGVGMTAEFVRERLFRPFESTKRAGMGIGVYESSQYLSSLGGSIAVDSSPGVGTTVRAIMPLADVVAEERKKEAA